MSKMPKSLYRFRSIKNLFKYSELEQQSLFFSPFETLNDPMEGFQKVVWNGDEILWHNFFKKYLSSLIHTSIDLMLGIDDDTLAPRIVSHCFFAELPTEKYRELYREITDEFFSSEIIKKLEVHLSNDWDEIDFASLLTFLHTVHSYAIGVVFSGFYNNHLISKENYHAMMYGAGLSEDNLASLAKLIDTSVDIKGDNRVAFSLISSIGRKRNEELMLIATYNLSTIKKSQRAKVYLEFLLQFPDWFLARLVERMYPELSCVCFTTEIFNSAMWGYYAGSHNGIALRFKVSQYNGEPCIPLVDEHERLHKVIYQADYLPIEFFSSLKGQLTESQLSEWIFSEEGNESRCCKEYKDNSWKESYWKKLNESGKVKLPDWKHEGEYRMLRAPLRGAGSGSGGQLAHYDFSSLEGVVFGMRVSIEDKLKIIRIIDRNCQREQCNKVKFFQATYDDVVNKIKIEEMSQIKISLETSHGYDDEFELIAHPKSGTEGGTL